MSRSRAHDVQLPGGLLRTGRPDWANIIAIAWRSMWSCDNNAQPLVFTPLYADEPQQLNIVNGELVYEQRFMLKLFLQVNQVVLPAAGLLHDTAGGDDHRRG